MITFLTIALAGLAFASCKKDRTCTCTDTTTPVGGAAVTSTDEVTIKKAKKGAALDGHCQSYSSQQTAPTAGTKWERNCELK
ncbi:MAG: hypothetical protein AB7O73_00390 [Bacteroidia bacterium]